MSFPRVGKQKVRDEMLPRAGSVRWAHLARVRGPRSGNDRLRTRVQNLSGAACGVAQALLPVSNAWKASALVTCLCHRATRADRPRWMAMRKRGNAQVPATALARPEKSPEVYCP
jgi:hypothetical protein